MKVFEEIYIKNFKSFLEETFTVEDLTAVVGANESGKTNVLLAINEFSKDNLYSGFGREKGDFRLDSPEFPAGEIVIRVSISLHSSLIPTFVKLEPHLEGKVLQIEKRGRLNEVPTVSARFSERLSDVTGILKVNNRGLFKSQMQGLLNKAQLDFAHTHGWLFKDSSIVLTKNPLARLLKDGKIENLKEEARDDFLAESVLGEVAQNIRTLFWEYEEDEHYLPEKVLTSDFVANPSRYPGVDCMFAIAGWDRDVYQKNLIEFDPTTRGQLLRTAQDAVNDLIKKHWTTHRELTVKLNYNGDYLDISLSEPGHETPPNFRSDGFKWFLAFLLFFKKHASSLSGHILLVDEPGGSLHPQGQKDVLKELTTLSSENQVIYTTHQTFLINKNMPESVRVIKREKRGAGSTRFYDSKVYPLLDTKHILTDQLLRESLGFLVSDISPLNESNVLVEGEFDREVFIEANKKFKIIDLNEVSFIACGRASNIAKHATLYLSNGLTVVGFYDSDKPAKDAMRTVKNFPILDLEEVTTDKVIKTMEDVLPAETFLSGVDAWKKQLGIKKQFTAVVPRIAQIDEVLEDKIDKLEQKHALEDCLAAAMKRDIRSNPDQFEDLRVILIKIREKLGN